MKTNLIILLVVGIALLVCVNCANNIEGGSVSVTFSFNNAPQQTVWIWAKVIVQEGDVNAGSSLASDGPHQYEPGNQLSIKLNGIPHGENRQVIVEVRDGPTNNLPVVFYGFSSTFSIIAGDSKGVDVSVALKNPEGKGTVKLLFLDGEKSAIGLSDITNATLEIESTGASSVLLSNSLSFAMFDSVRIEEGKEEISCNHETGDSENVTTCQYGGWNLLSGLFSSPDDAVDGRYYVYAKFIDENGYEGGIASVSVDLDTTAPQVISSSLIKYEEEGMEHATLLLSVNENLSLNPSKSALSVYPETDATPVFSGPEQVGFSSSYQWHSMIVLAEAKEDKTDYVFSVMLEDKMGNRGKEVSITDSNGDQIVYNKGCDCSNGPCCDGCYYKPTTTICDHGDKEEYGCPWGEGCENNIGMRSGHFYCSGNSAGCEENYGPWELFESCDAGTGCKVKSDGVECVDCSDFLKASSTCPVYNEGPDTYCYGSYYVMNICAEIDESGMVTVSAAKKDGGSFGDRPYQVRAFSTSAAPKCTHLDVVKAEDPSGIGTSTLVFPKFDPMIGVSGLDGYCVSASLKEGDIGYEGTPQQEASFCSPELILSIE